MNSRLDTRDRILCAVRDCGTALGFVLDYANNGSSERIALLPLGWRPQDGVWKPTAHAARNRIVYGTYKTRSTPKWADTPSERRSRKFVRVYPVPARIKCPGGGCGMVQVLDPITLRLASTWRPVHVAGGSGRRSSTGESRAPGSVSACKGRRGRLTANRGQETLRRLHAPI